MDNVVTLDLNPYLDSKNPWIQEFVIFAQIISFLQKPACTEELKEEFFREVQAVAARCKVHVRK